MPLLPCAVQEWYEAVNNIILLCLTSVSGSIHRQYSLVNGSISAGMTPADFSAEPSPFASPVSSFPVSTAFQTLCAPPVIAPLLAVYCIVVTGISTTPCV